LPENESACCLLAVGPAPKTTKLELKSPTTSAAVLSADNRFFRNVVVICILC
jgi:hypothetical protein